MTREERIRTAINQLPSIVPSELDDAWLLNGEYVSKESLVPVVAALLDAERPRWQPMDTAPKDGTPVLLYYPKRYQAQGGVTWGAFINGEWLDSQVIRDNGATHWQPLPAPPEDAP